MIRFYLLVIAIIIGAGVYVKSLLPQWGIGNQVTQSESALEMKVEFEPIALDCRARLHAEVPLRIERRHTALGVTYRTDVAEMVAVGDVETCVNTEDVVWTERYIAIPDSSIVINRPRVNTVATLDSVRSDKGFVGELTDIMPGVNDEDGTVPTLYAFAQQVIGSSECMALARANAVNLIVEAYEEKYNLPVRIEPGAPAEPEPDIQGLDVGTASCTLVE